MMDPADVLDDTMLHEGLPADARRRWTRAEFERAGELGFFGPSERLELIGGEVIRKMTPQYSPHATAVCLVADALRAAFAAGHHVRVQLPLALTPHNEPEPDVCVVSGTARDYAAAHPTSAVLVVEVSDTTLRFDRGTKAGLYALAGLPEFWVLNLRDRVLEIHREPGPISGRTFGHGYRSVTRERADAVVTCLAAAGAAIRVSDLLP